MEIFALLLASTLVSSNTESLKEKLKWPETKNLETVTQKFLPLRYFVLGRQTQVEPAAIIMHCLTQEKPRSAL